MCIHKNSLQNGLIWRPEKNKSHLHSFACQLSYKNMLNAVKWVVAVRLKTKMPGALYRIPFMCDRSLSLIVCHTHWSLQELSWHFTSVCQPGGEGFAHPAISLMKVAHVDSLTLITTGSVVTTRVSECFMVLSHCMTGLITPNEPIHRFWWCSALFSHSGIMTYSFLLG